MFYTGASAAAVVFVLLLVWYPESPSLLLAKGKSQDHIKKILVRAKPRFVFDEGVRITSADYESVSSYPVKALFAEGRARTTLLIWAMFFANLIALYSIQQWLPYAMHQSGADIKLAVSAGGIFQAGGVLGALVYSRVVDKFGYPFYLLSGCFVLAAVSFLLLGSPAISADPKIVTVFCAGLFVAGTQITLNSVATTLYPTAIRATAISWAVAVGRIGGVGGPILSGYLLQHGVSADGVLSGGAVPSTVAAIAALTLALSPHSSMKWNRNLKREKSA
ncbi:MFS transporter [Caballeronia sp. 15711]|uniref:MFS transporter n=1 Tax=Caballeronia sp. 15711 TaxID=3391029 RepID=UPI0039E6029B